jgi:hypothetical protein
MSRKVGPDGLTDAQRKWVSACVRYPDLDASDRARKCGVKIRPSDHARKMMQAPAVRIALAARTRSKKTGKLPNVTKEWLQQEMRKIYEDPKTPLNERTKLLRELGGTVEGFYVPLGVKHSGKLAIEDWVATMGGKPVEDDEEVTIQ